ncbi:MAG TPA: hypothetical protein PLD59_07165 [Tepidisphaeraceae bacterium]|nr:hypothetical protein [Tepidisphaeraceae bacterium]
MNRLSRNHSIRARSGRTGIVVVLVLAIIASVFTRHLALAQRKQNVVLGTSGTSLSSMNSYAIALLLGGLRGPLVMFLWPSSEMQKSERNLEDFDTKIEWIRLLQAEFDSVHIFQIWNKAYNISVQMANIGNKYSTILDALDYAHKVDRERPNNINIIAAIAGIYFDKLGNSQEKDYYKRRIRAESLPHESRQKARQDEAGWRRIELDPILDANGNVLPEYLKPGTVTLTDDERKLTYDGSELQYLKEFEPFPDGLSPFALAYNYYVRSSVLQEVGSQTHSQLSDLVIDSRPALSLKNWVEDELQFGRVNEITAAGKPIPAEREYMEDATIDLTADYSFSDDKLESVRKAIRAYDRAASVAIAADTAYEVHTKRYTTNLLLYREHRESVLAHGSLAAADAEYLRALIEPDAAKKKQMLESAALKYEKALDLQSIVLMRFNLPPDRTDNPDRPEGPPLYPPGTNRENLEQLTRAQRAVIVTNMMRALEAGLYTDTIDDAGVWLRAINRIVPRLRTLGR